MNTVHTPYIQLDFNGAQLAEMLTAEDRTPEEFQADVLSHLHAFLQAQQEKIAQCLMSIKGPYIHVTMRMNAVRYDEELQRACFSEDDVLVHDKGWSNVNIVLIPNAGTEATEAFHKVATANKG